MARYNIYYKYGDRVIVTRGDYRGQTGSVLGYRLSFWDGDAIFKVQLDSGEIHEFDSWSLQYGPPLKERKKKQHIATRLKKNNGVKATRKKVEDVLKRHNIDKPFTIRTIKLGDIRRDEIQLVTIKGSNLPRNIMKAKDELEEMFSAIVDFE